MDKFNQYCAEVMGYELDCEDRYMKNEQFVIYKLVYNPYNDLNQMAEVVEQLLKVYCVPKALCLFVMAVT